MQTTDMRSLSPDARHERRVQVIRLRKAGRTYDEIAEQTGLSRTGVFNICKRHQEIGAKALRDAPGGRKSGQGRTLELTQELLVRQLIADKTPDQLKMPYALWTRSAVGDLVHQQFDVKLPVRTVGHYLKRWGFTPQKPIRKAYEQRPAEVRKWLDTDYPKIAQRAKTEGAEIHWGDETGLRSDDVRGRSYAPKGQTPVVRVCSNRESLSLISSVTNQGKVRWMVFAGALNAKILIRFLKRLIRDAQRKVLLIVVNLRVHLAKVVREWLATHVEQLEVFYLPSYSPELNPDECLNADLKQAITSQAPARSKGQLKKATVGHLRKLTKLPQRVMSYFQHRPVRYAA